MLPGSGINALRPIRFRGAIKGLSPLGSVYQFLGIHLVSSILSAAAEGWGAWAGTVVWDS
jgi:hypothetical protein